MQRVIDALKKLDSSRILSLFGSGVADSYLTPNLQEVDLAFALDQSLIERGFSRIVFTSPTRPIFFLDETSQTLSQSFLWAGHSAHSDSPLDETMQPGPFGTRLFMAGPGDLVKINFDSIGDTHLVRLLNSAMTEANGPPTTIVFTQAETYFLRHQDQRTLSSILESWASLPASNHNRCVFLFSANNYVDLCDITQNIPIPELRSTILRNRSKAQKNHSIHHLDGPQLDEAARLLEFLKRSDWTDIDPEYEDQLVRQIAAEGEPMQVWLSRFSSISRVDRSVVTEHAWFSQNMGDPTPPVERLNRLTGLDEIKARITELAGWAAGRARLRSSRNTAPLLHMIFMGNPGTGKTTVARILGELMFEMGILSRGHLVETKSADLIADYVGGTAIKTNDVIDKALGGILFIDEAYSLSAKDRGGFGQEAIETLLTRMEDQRDELIVILAGYPDQIRGFIQSNPGLSRRFPVENRFVFRGFTTTELHDIFNQMVEERGISIAVDLQPSFQRMLDGMVLSAGPNFGNAGEIRNFVDSLERRCLSRMVRLRQRGVPTLIMEDIPTEYLSYLPAHVPPVDQILHHLDDLVGLDDVKRYVRRRVARLRFDQLRQPDDFQAHLNPIQHLIFTGNPGTGKTTVARLFGQMYASLGLLRKGHVVEVSMSDLVAGYVGQTSGKVLDQVEKALDGVLFIDEAYALVRGNSMFQGSFGQEVIDTLVKAIEDHRHHLLVIMAGYTREMEILLRSNPGLKSRFAPPLVFPDLQAEDLSQLLEKLLQTDRLGIQPEAAHELINQLETRRTSDPATFGNARDLISTYERAKDHLAERVIRSRSDEAGARRLGQNEQYVINLEDVRDESVDIVIGGIESDGSRQAAPLKSWVLPKK